MAKYNPLRKYLKAMTPDVSDITLTFAKVEIVLGRSLPASARDYREWWGNENNPTSHVQACAWMRAGWSVDGVDLESETVQFRRGA
jgi:hypothetical protein